MRPRFAVCAGLSASSSAEFENSHKTVQYFLNWLTDFFLEDWIVFPHYLVEY